MPVINHVHKYLRVRSYRDRKYITWRCVLPTCTHTIAHAFISGKESVCWKCEGKMLMSGRALQRERPTCERCRGIKQQKALEKVDAVLEGLDLKDII